MYGQFFLLFALILVGYYCNKKGWLNRETNKNMSGMVVHVMIPAMIITAIANIEITGAILKGFFLFVLAQFALAVVFGFLMRFYCRKRGLEEKLMPMLDITTGSMNTGFIGLPVAAIFLGETGVMYMSAGVLSLNLYLWSYAICTIESVNGKGNGGAARTAKKILTNVNCQAVFIGILLAATGASAYIPEMVLTFLKKVGDLATPLSLIYIGALAGSSGIMSLLKEKTAFELSVVKMIGLPLLAILIMMVVPAGPMAKSAFLLAAALPAAVVVPMMVEQYGYGEKLSSDIVLWSTLISMVTMPLCVWIAGILY